MELRSRLRLEVVGETVRSHDREQSEGGTAGIVIIGLFWFFPIILNEMMA